jgi:putative acetyltransferase
VSLPGCGWLLHPTFGADRDADWRDPARVYTAGTTPAYTAPVTSTEINVDDPRKPEVRALLERHLTFCLTETPPEHSFALDVSGLLDPAVTFVSYRDGESVLGVAAIKELDTAHAEIKSMHTAAEARGRGVGRALLSHLLGVAGSRGYERVSLETGTTPGFAAARALYESAGFTPTGPFGGYPVTGDNCFYTRIL